MPRNSPRRWIWPALALVAFAGFTAAEAAGQQSGGVEQVSVVMPGDGDKDLPDAPTPNLPAADEQGGATIDPHADPPLPSGPAAGQQETSPGYPPISPDLKHLPGTPGQHPGIPSMPPVCRANICSATPQSLCCAVPPNYFARFLVSGPHPLSPKQKAILALRNTTDPYNFATIAFISALSTASDPDSPYGPGVPGFGRNFGVAYCETAVGEFFGTFLVPALAHQDPHYHRMPNASYPRRVWHAISQVAWTQSDYGTGMPNYANFVATAVGDGLGDLYVPGRDTSVGAGTTRYFTALATDPIDNFITEFLPDVARRVNIRIVLLQQIVNQVTKQQ